MVDVRSNIYISVHVYINHIRLSTAFLRKCMAKVILDNILKEVMYIQVVISTTKLEIVICSRLHQNWERICKDKGCSKALWLKQNMSPVKRICVFEHSVITNFNCPCPAIQRGQGSGFLSEGSSWFTACIGDKYQIRLTRPIYFMGCSNKTF